MKKLNSVIAMIIFVAVDQISKNIISQKMLIGESVKLIPNFFYLTYVRNTGAGFSLLEGKRSLFLVITVVAVMGFGYLWWKTPENNRAERFSYVLILAGTFGNFIDRLYHGSVVDFFDFRIFGYDFPVFNVADILLTLGVGLLILLTLKKEKENA